MILRKLLLAITLLLLLPLTLKAQGGNTTIIGTVKDASNNPYSNSRVSISFFDPGTSHKLPLLNGSTFQVTYTGYATDSFGGLPPISLADNGVIGTGSGATGTQWSISICFSNQVTCFQTKLTIDCANNIPAVCVANTIDITAALQAVAAPLPTVTLPASLNGNNNFLGSNSFSQISGCYHVNALQSFASALAAVSSPGCIQIDPGTYPVSSNAAIGQTVTLVSTSGGILSISTGVTLTINGPFVGNNGQAFLLNGTGLVAFGLSPSPVDYFKPQWWGAIGNDAHDDTAAINAAVVAAAGRPVYLSAGKYLTTLDILYSTSGDVPGLKMYGDGGDVLTANGSIIDARLGVGGGIAAIRMEGVGVTGQYQRGGYIRNISITCIATCGSGVGIKLTGTWGMNIKHVAVTFMAGDAIQFPIRSDLGGNPDLYANNYWVIEQSNLTENGGWGINQLDGPDGLGSVIANNITQNVLGGMYLTGEAFRVTNNTFSYNGNTNTGLTSCAGPLAPGLLVDTGPSGGADSLVIEDNEFDANCYVNLWIRRGIGMRIGPNRQLSHINTVAQDTINRPPVHIRLDGVTAVESFQLHNMRHRGDFGGVNDQNLTLYQINQAGLGNISGGLITDPFVAVGNISANTTTYSTAGGAVVTVTQSGGVVQNSAVIISRGAGYQNAPTCSIIDQLAGGAGATCTVTTTRGVVDILTTAPGSGYTTGATVALSGGGCAVQGTASAATVNNGVSFITLLTSGSGCTSNPTCTVSPVGAGSGATCISGSAQVINTVTVTAGGAGYVSPHVVITPSATDSGISAAAFGTAPTQLDITDRVSNQSFTNVPSLNIPLTSLGVIKFGADLGLSRQAAGTLGVGNTTQGDISGTVRAASFVVSGGAGAITLSNSNANFSESSCAGAALNNDILCANSTNHKFQISNNNGAFSDVAAMGFANTGLAAMTLNMAASTAANSFVVPAQAGLTSGTNGAIAYDTTAGNTHIRTNAADSLAAAEAAALAANTIPKATDATHSLLAASSCTDNGTVFSCTEGFSPPQAAGIIGTTTNNNANAGSVGEYVASTIVTGSSVTLATGVTSNITSISLTAGDWDVTGAVDFTFGATTSYTNLIGSVSSTSATIGAQDSKFDFETPAVVPTAGADATFPLPVVRFSLSGTTTVFLVAQGTFTVSTLKAYGTIRARRIR